MASRKETNSQKEEIKECQTVPLLLRWWRDFKSSNDMCDSIEKIYKYYPCNKYSLNVLKDNQLFFSHPSNFNDPFDSSFDLLVKPYKKFCEALNGIEKMTDVFEKQGICCFTKSSKPDNKHFWSLYAGNYTGFALEFDENELNNKYPPLHLSRVNYFDKPMILMTSI